MKTMRSPTHHALILLCVIMGYCGAAFAQSIERPDADRESAAVDRAPAAAIDGPVPELPAFTDDAEVSEPDYAEVAADARKIADEIETREIEQHMLDAGAELFKPDVGQGYPRTEEAYVDMKEMIKFCQSMGGKAGKACKFKLQISMGLNPGNTLSQFGGGMSSGMGTGFSGMFGQGASGQSGGGSPFAIFGPESFGQKSLQSSRLGNRKLRATVSPRELSDPLADNVDELSSSKRSDFEVSVEGDQRIMEEYRGLIEAYFKQLAEEESEQ